jgi:FlaA1/EpsC-like NDP-sugar epimerase
MTFSRIRNRYILVVDTLLVLFAAYAAFALRLEWVMPDQIEPLYYAAVCVLVKPAMFHFLGLYRRYWRYASAQDMLALGVAVSAAQIAVAAVVTVSLLANVIVWMPRSIVFIDWMLTLVFTGALRLSVRVIAETSDRSAEPTATAKRRVLIVGAGRSGSIVARELQRERGRRMEAIGLLDDDPLKIGKRIYGLTVLGPLDSLPKIVKTYKLSEVVIAMPTASGALVRRLVEQSRQLGIHARIVPGVVELLDQQVSVSRIRNVDIADLLRRAPVAADAPGNAYLTNSRVLVTGAGGSIGSELCRQIAQASPALLVLTGHGENSIFEISEQLREALPNVPIHAVIADVRDGQRLDRVFAQFTPDIVLHAAAHKHVPLMEWNPEEAITNNVLGTMNVVDAAVRAGTRRLVLISTDKAVAPTSVMGASKRLAESIVRHSAIRHERAFDVVRFGNVLGSRGSVVPVFKRQIERGGPLMITHPDMKRFFMTIPEAVHLVLEAGGIGTGGDLFVLNMGEPVRIMQLAEDLIRLSGYTPEEIAIVFTGLRPGEKLEERLWEAGGQVEPTSIPAILRVDEPRLPFEDRLGDIVGDLITAARAGDRATLQQLLSEAMPGCRGLSGGASAVLPQSV